MPPATVNATGVAVRKPPYSPNVPSGCRTNAAEPSGATEAAVSPVATALPRYAAPGMPSMGRTAPNCSSKMKPVTGPATPAEGCAQPVAASAPIAITSLPLCICK